MLRQPMPRIRPEFESGALATRVSLATVGRLAVRAGAAITLTAAPLALATFLLVLADAPTVAAGLDAAASATTGPIGDGGGIGWLLHAGVLGVLVGTWILGAGLVVSGLTD